MSTVPAASARVRRLLGQAVLALAAVAALAALAACGSSSKADGTNTQDADAARVKYTQCMRDQGVNLPDPGQGGGQAFRVTGSRAKMQAADKACAKYRKAAFGTVSASQRQEFSDAFTKFSACMRQRGVDIPTPTPGTGGGPPAGGGQRPNFNSPAAKAASTACRKLLPQGTGLRGGPGGGAPPAG